MAVRLILNGFFRSGTTMLWSGIRADNPGLLAFYEPFNDRLIRSVEAYRRTGEAHWSHGEHLWQDYLAVPGCLDSICTANQGALGALPSGTQAVSIIRRFHSLGRDCIVKDNRLQFVVGDLVEALGCPVAHIVRNPLTVYRSMQAFYRRDGAKGIVVLKRLLGPVISHRAFNLHGMYRCIRARAGRSGNAARFPPLAAMWMRPFDVFLVVWAVSNSHAVLAVARHGGLVMEYGHLLTHGEEFRGELERRSGLRFDATRFRAPRPEDLFPTRNDCVALEARIRRLGLEKEWSVIQENLPCS